MEKEELKALLSAVKEGSCDLDDAVLKLKEDPYTEVGNYARIDEHRSLRQGSQEVIFGQGKTREQIAGILESMLKRGAKNILVTRLSEEKMAYIEGLFPADCRRDAGLAVVNPVPVKKTGNIVIVSGGTSDIPVCEEAAITAETLGNRVTRVYDVGVAGLHRLLHNLDPIMSARVIIAVAGMEGALASVVGGLVDCPVIAVPTSVGYGASFQGLSALLSMLNSCASGVSVVNIDNGFGAGFLASRINKMETAKEPAPEEE